MGSRSGGISGSGSVAGAVIWSTHPPRCSRCALLMSLPRLPTIRSPPGEAPSPATRGGTRSGSGHARAGPEPVNLYRKMLE